MNPADVMGASNAILDEIDKAIVGKRDQAALILMAVLADGHILLEDVPGVAKTALARAIAEATGLSFSRLQFTPDLIPADITGSAVLTKLGSEPEFKPGPIFASLVLGDEINRAPPKTQSALLEAMEERQVTADGVTHRLPEPFLVIGTQNPIEQEGTYPLPEAQLDRFLIRTGIGYPGTENEIDLILRRAQRGVERKELSPVLGKGAMLSLQKAVERVHVSEPVARYVVGIVEATRTSPRTEAGASPRGSLGLLKMTRARAAMAGRGYVLPDDVKAVAVPVLAHRIILQPDQWVRGVKPEQVVNEILSQISAPAGADESDREAMRQSGVADAIPTSPGPTAQYQVSPMGQPPPGSPIRHSPGAF